MRNLRISLAAAAALLLATMPGSASANSNEQCRSEWDASSASDICTFSLSVSWQSWSEECRIKVACTRSDGISFQQNDLESNLYLVSDYVDCDGVLKLLTC